MASGMSANTVAKQLKRNRRTVAKFLDEPGTKEALDNMFEKIARQALDGIEPEQLAKASFLQRVTAAAIAVDKMQLLRNQPTQITQINILLDAVTAIKEMRAAQNGGVRLSLPAEVQAPAPDLPDLHVEQQPVMPPVMRVAQPTIERHRTRYYAVPQPEQREQRRPLQQPPDPD
jgi:hypothetical protein